MMPTGRDASLVCATLQKEGIDARSCPTAEDLEDKISAGVGAVLIAEEALQNRNLDQIVRSFDDQPIWSDIPIVLFARNAKSSGKLLEIVGTRLNATIVERPIRITMLISAVLGALRARERQYQARDLLDQLKQADEQKDLFLATLSHELRTPLNSMLGWIQILRTKQHSEKEFNQALEVIERSTKSQTELVSDILLISRVITGNIKLKMEMIGLEETIQDAVNIIRPAMEAKNIELIFSFESNVKNVFADAERLQQIFLNLLSNAIKFTPQNGRVEISASDKDSSVEIAIRDSGEGIKKEFLPYVFERFRQADSSYTRAFSGLGLGLAIVHHLVELHDGNVRVESEGENQGAVFTVSLPLQSEPASQTFSPKDQPKMSPPAEQSLKGKHILLVEDDRDSREMLEVLFAQNDIETTAVETAAKALETLPKIRADILISDVGLPGEDGYELMRKIRNLSPEEGGLIPAIALTGYASLQDRNIAITAGYQKHLAKPVDIEELLELIKNLLKPNN